MFTLRCKLFVLISSVCILPTHAAECPIKSTKLHTRILKDLPDLELNKYPLSLGNSVIFHTSDIPVIPKNAFVTYDTKSIRKVAANGKSIHHIENDAFNGLECLIILDLSNNALSQITKGIFKGLDFLLDLDLSNNVLQDLPDKVFSHVSCLRKLSLAYNKLSDLSVESFFKLQKLEELDLSNNNFKKILATALQYFGSLINLQMGSNQIEDLHIANWTATNKLQILNISDNALLSFDTSINYSFSNTLIELYLHNNCLTNLFVSDLTKRFSSLQLITIYNNFWNCADLFRIIHKLKKLKVNHSRNMKTQPNIDEVGCNRSFNTKTKRFRRSEVIPQIALSLANETDKEDNLKKEEKSEPIWDFITWGVVVVILVLLLVVLAIELQCHERCRVIFWALRRRNIKLGVATLSQPTQLSGSNGNYGSLRSDMPLLRTPYTESLSLSADMPLVHTKYIETISLSSDVLRVGTPYTESLSLSSSSDIPHVSTPYTKSLRSDMALVHAPHTKPEAESAPQTSEGSETYQSLSV